MLSLGCFLILSVAKLVDTFTGQGHEDTTQNVWHLGWELCRLMRAITTIIASADLHQDGNVILTPYTIHSHILIVVIVVLFAIHWH